MKEEDIPRFAGNIYTETQRLISLVGDIIRLSQLDEGSVPPEKADVNLAEITAAVVDRLRPAAEGRGIVFDLWLEPAAVRGNAQILDDVMMTDSMYRSMPTFSMGIKMAAVVLTMLPIMCVFPFLQKYFVKGVTLGAVKG